jgi:hypothetical protein
MKLSNYNASRQWYTKIKRLVAAADGTLRAVTSSGGNKKKVKNEAIEPLPPRQRWSLQEAVHWLLRPPVSLHQNLQPLGKASRIRGRIYSGKSTQKVFPVELNSRLHWLGEWYFARSLLISNAEQVNYSFDLEACLCGTAINSKCIVHTVQHGVLNRRRYVTAPSNGLSIKSSSFPSGPCSLVYREDESPSRCQLDSHTRLSLGADVAEVSCRFPDSFCSCHAWLGCPTGWRCTTV